MTQPATVNVNVSDQSAIQQKNKEILIKLMQKDYQGLMEDLQKCIEQPSCTRGQCAATYEALQNSANQIANFTGYSPQRHTVYVKRYLTWQ